MSKQYESALEELNDIMARMGWDTTMVGELLPRNGKPRSRYTVYAWTKASQKDDIPDTELKLLRIIAAIEEGASPRTLRKLTGLPKK